MIHVWWFHYVLSLSAMIALPVFLGTNWWKRIIGAILMIVMWCMIQFTVGGQLWACESDPYQDSPCYVSMPQRHIGPPMRWWKTPPTP